MDKRGVSTVVAVVLLLLAVVIAVSLVWTMVVPPIRDKMILEQLCSEVDIEIVGGRDSTCFDTTTSGVGVKLDRGSSENAISEFQIIFSFDGNSNKTERSFSAGDHPREVFDFCFWDGVSSCIEPNGVSVAPIITYGKTKRVCDIVSTIDEFPPCSSGVAP